MKTARKALVLAACAIMLVCATIAGTLAYLTANDSVSNTFTVGNVNITLDEAKVNPDGTYVTDVEDRTDSNEYKLMPGKDYIKDPTIHVQAGSENCYVFVKVENGIADIEAAGDTTIAEQMKALGWVEIAQGIYGKEAAVSAGTDVVVFNDFTIAGDVDSTELANYAGKTINVTAYAIQAEGFTTAQLAWTNAGAEAQA